MFDSLYIIIHILYQVEQLLAEKRLPLFTLDLVVYPGQQFPLNIFEPRYKIMFDSILSKQDLDEPTLQHGLFGVSVHVI